MHNTPIFEHKPTDPNLGKKIAEGRKAGRASKNPLYSPVPRCWMISVQFSSLLAQILILGLLPGGGTWRKKAILPNRFPCAIPCTQY